ncbi:hypothetical protein EUX98_g5686 [Antrodiella citrinella]|uniref:Uncharacterized protein n=1 Tax=Antrodiella citrinella TaxID=2447956 RepID=A0A4S4MRU0_9APHY|nr:hypothetical protein EUX98_g5686 [Antrodiella citrinella]
MELSRSEPGDIPFISDALKDVVLHAPATLSQLRIHLTFELVYSSNRLLFVEGMPWGIIDAHLSTLPIPSVEVLFSNLDDLPSVEGPLFSQASALVKERLPRLMALKVLVVCQSFGQGWR